MMDTIVLGTKVMKGYIIQLIILHISTVAFANIKPQYNMAFHWKKLDYNGQS